jgi:iodotyrosine deiodinase
MAPYGANHHPWFFVAILDAEFKQQVRVAAGKEEKKFYEGGGGYEWIKALEALRTVRKIPI